MATIYKRHHTYYIGLMVDGVQKCISLKTRNLQEAQRKARKYEKENNSVSLIDVLENWDINAELLGKSTRYRKDADEFMKEFIGWYGNKPASCVSYLDLMNYWTKYLHKEKRYNSTTIAIRLRTLKAMFNFAYKQQMIDTQPFRSFVIVKGKSKEGFLEKNDIIKLLKVAEKNPLEQNFLLFLLLTGCRAGEIKTLKWRKVTETHIEFNGKSGKRTFPMDAEIKRVLDKIKELQPDDCEYVLSTAKGWIGGHNWIGVIVKKYMRLAGLSESLSCHSLRHTFCSQRVQRGDNLYLIKELCGHSSIITTQGYAHLRPELMKTKTKYW